MPTRLNLIFLFPVTVTAIIGLLSRWPTIAFMMHWPTNVVPPSVNRAIVTPQLVGTVLSSN